MKSLLKFSAIAALAMGLFVGCNDLEGTTQVTRELKYNIKPFSTSQATVPVGPYKTTIKQKNKELVQIELFLNKKQSYELKLQTPKNSSIPKDGPFNLPGTVSGQPFDVNGFVSNQYEQSRTYREWERCTYQERERYCYSDGHGGARCEWRYVDRWGMQDVEYYYLTHTRTINFGLVQTGAAVNDPNAVFNAVEKSTQKRIVYQGICR